MVPTVPVCPVCRRSLALGDRNGRYVASEAHYPHLDTSGAMVCSPPSGEVQLGVQGRSGTSTVPVGHIRNLGP